MEHRQEEVFDRDVDHEKAVRAEEECIVLLANDVIVEGATEVTEDGEIIGDNITERAVLPLSKMRRLLLSVALQRILDSREVEAVI